MSRIFADNAQSIGNTPLVRINRLGPAGVTILAKIEGRNPGYSVKCRIGANMIWDAEQRGVLKPGMTIEKEEIFGPVAAVIPFKDEEEALRIANGTVYSRAAVVWTADMARAHRFTRKLKAGTIWVNTYGPTDIRLPWCGARDSGFGREHGEAAIENFTESKSVWINTGL